jgi:anti-sigma factor RsiW
MVAQADKASTPQPAAGYSPMTCREFVGFLMLYLSAGLSPERRSRFEEHLAECPDCVAYLDSYQQTIRLGKEAFADPEADVPADVPEELVRAIVAALKEPD